MLHYVITHLISLGENYGKKIIIIGGGAAVAKVAQGAITEADPRHIRGERISATTASFSGRRIQTAEEVSGVGLLPDSVLCSFCGIDHGW